MADHVYKPSEVPKGQRWQQFLDYYKTPCIFMILGIVILISILQATVFSTKADMTILAGYNQFIDSAFWEQAMDEFSSMSFDFNEDEKSVVKIESIFMDASVKGSNPEMYMAYQSKLMASLVGAKSALQIADDEVLEILEAQNLLGTYGELPDSMGHSADEVIKIPLSELAPFKKMENLPEGLYMTLRPEEAMQIGGSQKKLAAYQKQVEALVAMMN